MCSAPSAKQTTPEPTTTYIPPEPETVKRTESEVSRAREAAKAAASRRYGVSGTNVTGGSLANTAPETKKQKLGGA